MDIEAIIKGVFFVFILLLVMFLYQLIIYKIAKSATKKIWVGFGAFTIFNVLYLSSDALYFITDNPDVLESLINLIKLFWWLSLNYLVNQLVDYWVWNQYFVAKGIVASRILRDMVSMVLIILTLAAIVYFVYNKSVLGIFTASGVMAIILGYSAQALLSDVFAGLGLNTSKEFKQGDWIKVNDQVAKIEELSWRFVKFITPDNNNLYIPNSVIAKLPIINLSSPTKTRSITIKFPLRDNTPPHRFKKLLIEAALQCPWVLKDPAPSASIPSLIQYLEFNAIAYNLTYHTNELDDGFVSDNIMSIVWYQCRRNNIKIQLHDVEQPEPLSLSAIEAFLKHSELFSMLNSDELELLTSGAICHHFGPPERILEQGQSNSSLFMIYNGSVDIYFTENVDTPTYVASLESGQYFGEMSLLTGEACSATILAKEESVIIEITHDNISSIFLARHELVEHISEIVIKRRLSNDQLRASLAKMNKVDTTSILSKMVKSVKEFFNIKKS